MTEIGAALGLGSVLRYWVEEIQDNEYPDEAEIILD